jgi:FkbM family methyltransferase
VKHRRINDIYDLIVPDHVADWDAPSDWEKERIADTIARLDQDDTLLDVGVEHGWISGLYAKYIGCEMILCEPSPEFWRNIRLVWRHNELPDPLMCVRGFMSDKANDVLTSWSDQWPNEAQTHGPEIDAMAYRNLFSNEEQTRPIPARRIDDLPIIPTAITIDVEGAELLVLRGAEDTLTKYRPTVWCSIHPEMTERDYGYPAVHVLEYMEKMNYSSELLAIDHEEHWRFDPL